MFVGHAVKMTVMLILCREFDKGLADGFKSPAGPEATHEIRTNPVINVLKDGGRWVGGWLPECPMEVMLLSIECVCDT